MTFDLRRAIEEENTKKWEFRLAILIGALSFITIMLAWAGGAPPPL